MRRSYRDDPETGAFDGERVFSSRVDLRYLFERATEHPDLLVVAFSAAHERGEPARYYTVRVLRELLCHRLFILDDQGPGAPHPRPSWYLGRDRSSDVAETVTELMREITAELGLERGRVVTCGASKGGWAALYFAARFGAGHVVAGEPQVMLGKHLLQDENLDIARHVAGGAATDDGEFLDNLLFDAFRHADPLPSVHLFCGRGSLYYERDVRPLSRFLAQHGVPCEVELGDFADHVPDLGIHFPAFLTRQLGALLERQP
jgi:hypothetical protein